MHKSPVYKADKVTTPLLIARTTPTDSAVDPNRSLEWYYSLARQDKNAWLLSYKGENHALSQKNNKLDYAMRMAQFFDHFLKGAKGRRPRSG